MYWRNNASIPTACYCSLPHACRKQTLHKCRACSNELTDKRTALLAIEELIKAKVTVENSVRINALARSIKTVMNSCSDNRILKQCAQVRFATQ